MLKGSVKPCWAHCASRPRQEVETHGVSLRLGAQPFLCVIDLILICGSGVNREQENNAILIICGWFPLLHHICVLMLATAESN